MVAVMSFMREAVGVLLAGGQGERLWPLTRDRAKPAVPFGGTYRIIDITLSNCINSGLRRVFVLTQYKALSFNRHLRRGWSGIMGLGDFIEILPPQMRVSTHWYRGTADAVYQNIYSIGSERSSYVVVLSGDHIYKMNYEKMLQQHVDSGAHATVASLEVSVEDAANKFGVLETDSDWRVLRFEEKPANPAAFPIASRQSKCVDGNLYFQYAVADSHSDCRRGRSEFHRTISAMIFCRKSSRNIACSLTTLKMKINRGRSILARRWHARRLLRSKYGFGFRLADFQPLR